MSRNSQDGNARKRTASSDAALHYRAVSTHASVDRGSKAYSDLPLVEEGRSAEDDQKMLVMSFIAMIFIGLGNKIFQKLQTIPMHNYPNFLNLLTTFVYIPISFAYVIPAKKAGIITPEQLAVPKKDFAVMGFLDCIAGIMQIFAATYLPGGLIILLLQSAIPVSMFLSASILKEKYHVTQYIAAIVVCGGIFLVLEPSILGGDDGGGSNTVLWAIVLILSCVPMCLSSIYKEVALGDTDLDPVYLNAWIAVFQFLFSVPLAIPAAIAGEPPVYPPDLPTNLINGLKCYFGMSSVECNDYGNDDDSCSPDNCYFQAPIFVTVYMLFNVAYNILIIFILKYGSANILWLAMTVMVPLGNLAFSLPFMPQNSTITPFDIAGLVIIMFGLVSYRQGPTLYEKYYGKGETDGQPTLSVEKSATSIDKRGLLDLNNDYN